MLSTKHAQSHLWGVGKGVTSATAMHAGCLEGACRLLRAACLRLQTKTALPHTTALHVGVTLHRCRKDSDVSLPRGLSQAAHESGVRCHARLKTFVEFRHYQALFQMESAVCSRARTRLFPVRIQRPLRKAS
jgi:hypothetical protein